eukprot:TRINITY_DN27961_c0_g1_i1.p1 TRINITY_DN27961_c0_g1~~TRINITY_DN27961_c0_g1_i1.p1  ORF type:complete len:261 (+),score=42.12 TRINITY_DN27961_c0_g1_i1:542-1324(+)
MARASATVSSKPSHLLTNISLSSFFRRWRSVLGKPWQGNGFWSAPITRRFQRMLEGKATMIKAMPKPKARKPVAASIGGSTWFETAVAINNDGVVATALASYRPSYRSTAGVPWCISILLGGKAAGVRSVLGSGLGCWIHSKSGCAWVLTVSAALSSDDMTEYLESIARANANMLVQSIAPAGFVVWWPAGMFPFILPSSVETDNVVDLVVLPHVSETFLGEVDADARASFETACKQFLSGSQEPESRFNSVLQIFESYT